MVLLPFHERVTDDAFFWHAIPIYSTLIGQSYKGAVLIAPHVVIEAFKWVYLDSLVEIWGVQVNVSRTPLCDRYPSRDLVHYPRLPKYLRQKLGDRVTSTVSLETINKVADYVRSKPLPTKALSLFPPSTPTSHDYIP